MKLIRNAIVYKASLPAAQVLATHLQEMPYSPIPEHLLASHGFVESSATGELVTPLEGGMAFTFRRAEKILPAGAVRAAVDAEIERVEAELSEQAGEQVHMDDDDLNAIKDRVLADLVGKALHTASTVTCFYHAESRFLVVPTTSKRLASIIVVALVEACGAVETTTINISDVKGGLTSRLVSYFGEDNTAAFEGFSLGDSVVMKGEAGKASFDLENLDHAKLGVSEALRGGLVAERLELVRNDAVSFRLTHQFSLRCIEFLLEPTDEQVEEQDGWDSAYRWRHEAAVQLALIVDALNALCDLFGYQGPAGESQDRKAVPQGI